MIKLKFYHHFGVHKHILRLNSASQKMAIFMPLASKKYIDLTDDEVIIMTTKCGGTQMVRY